jgi:hypothetical protein
MQCFLLYYRLQAVIGLTPRDARMVTTCKALLLKTYGLHVPEVVEQAGNHDSDDISESILRQYHPAVLTEKYPAETTGDGNCFYRAVSRALIVILSVHSFEDSQLPHLLRLRSQEVCRFGIGQQDCCCDICTTSKRYR